MSVKTEAETLSSTSSFSSAAVSSVSALLAMSGTVSSTFLFWLRYLQGPFLFFASLTKLQLCPGLPHLILILPDCIPLLFLGHLPLLPRSMHFLLALQFNQHIPTQPRQSLAFFDQFLAPGKLNLLHSKEGVPKDLPGLYCFLVPEDTFTEGPIY